MNVLAAASVFFLVRGGTQGGLPTRQFKRTPASHRPHGSNRDAPCRNRRAPLSATVTDGRGSDVTLAGPPDGGATARS